MNVHDFIKLVYSRFLVNSNHKLLCQLIREARTFQETNRQIHKKEVRILQQGLNRIASVTEKLQAARRAQEEELRIILQGINLITEVTEELQTTRKEQEQKSSTLKQYLQEQFSSARNFLEAKNHRESKVKVSVIIPIYNTEAWLRQCLDSVLCQDLDSFEIICIDDGSTDSSSSILLEYAHRDQRVRFFSIPHQGVGHARNVALQKAVGEYVYFLDSDDLLEKGALKVLYTDASSLDLDVLYFDGRLFHDPPGLGKTYPHPLNNPRHTRPKEYSDIENGQALFCEMWKDLTYNAIVSLQITRRSFIERYDLSFPEGVFYEDEVFTLSCMLHASRVSHRQIVFHVRRLRPNSIMTSTLTEEHIFSYFKSWLVFALVISEIPMIKEAMECATDYLQMMYSRNRRIINGFDKTISEHSQYFSSFSYYIFDKLFNTGYANDNTAKPYIIKGFSQAEENFTWTDGHEAQMAFRLQPDLAGKDLICRFEHNTYAGKQRVTVKVNGTAVLGYESTGSQQKEFLIPATLIKNGVLVLTFILPDAVSPNTREESEDTRELAIAMQSLSISEAPVKAEAAKALTAPPYIYQTGTLLSFKGGEMS